MSHDKYTLCTDCKEAERLGKRAKRGCQGMALFCKDRQGPARWTQDNIVWVCCFVAQIARNDDPNDPAIKAKINSVDVQQHDPQRNVALAQKIFNYMTFRAAREGLKHEMTVDWYKESLDKGYGGFFGVQHDTTRITGDAQKPKLWQEWSAATAKKK